MAFTLKWKIILLIYILINILIVFKVLRFPTEEEERSEEKRKIVVRRLRYVFCPICYIAWFTATVCLGFNTIYSPIAEVVTVPKKEIEYIYYNNCDDCDICIESLFQEFLDEHWDDNDEYRKEYEIDCLQYDFNYSYEEYLREYYFEY